MDNENTGKKDRRAKVLKVLGVIGAVFFFLSYIPFVILPFCAQLGIEDGILSSRTVFGWEAVTTVFFWCCVIPIFPICILYQLAFGLLYIRRKHIALKIAAALTCAAVVIATAIPCLLYIPKERARVEELSPEVRSYLEGKYGSELAQEAKLKLYEYIPGTFHATSQVIPNDHWFELDHAPDGYYDDLINVFCGQNTKYEEGFRNYIDDKYDLPEDMHSQPHISSIDFTGYKHGDDTSKLYPQTGYEVAGVTVTMEHDEIVQKNLQKLAMRVVNDICPRFEEEHRLGHFMVYIRDVDFQETAASIQIDFPCADTLNYTVVQIEPRIYDDMPDTIWEDGFFAEEVNDVGYFD
ncbi:MAG: hypothetical protein J6X33_07625 [Clostridiales bacterium]|nr:hypothetical protein [Clostridiales bacterium]